MSLKYAYYLFDFDGTIADTGEGIRECVAWSLEQLGRPPLSEDTRNRFIGPPLVDSYMRYCGMTETEAEEAVRVYRQRYTDIGLYEASLYPGIAPLLRELHRRGAWVALASAKPRFMVERLAAHFGIDAFLDRIVGVGLERHAADKQDLILSALPEGADCSRAVMAGDRLYDIEAAKALGMAAAGADYGYSLPGELEAAGADGVFAEVGDMAAWMLGGESPRGLFVSLEGSDGCGKSTQIALLRDWLARRGFEPVLTREPGGCPISERIREIILSLDSKGMSSECEALLYAASRVEHVREVIEPALKCGKIVICDRFLDSSLAYQGYGRELGVDYVRQINAPATRSAAPDLTLLLRVDRDRARRRMAQGAPLDRLEIEQEDFFARVQAGFDALAQAEPDRVIPVDASRSIEQVFSDVSAAVGRAIYGIRE